jgi:hypothetical protein
MATSGHENEFINVSGLKAALQAFSTDAKSKYAKVPQVVFDLPTAAEANVGTIYFVPKMYSTSADAAPYQGASIYVADVTKSLVAGDKIRVTGQSQMVLVWKNGATSTQSGFLAGPSSPSAIYTATSSISVKPGSTTQNGSITYQVIKANGSGQYDCYMCTKDTSGNIYYMPVNTIAEWARAASKPTYTLSQVGATSSVIATTAANTNATCSITGASNAGKVQTIVYTNSSGSDRTVTISTTYKTPTGAAMEIVCPAGGYCEVSFINIGGTVYARGV